MQQNFDQAFSKYSKNICGAYEKLNCEHERIIHSLSRFKYNQELELGDLFKLMFEGILQRLSSIGCADSLLQSPFLKRFYFNNKEIHFPIINEQGKEWYEFSTPFNYDFYIEAHLGLHHKAHVIYDIGAHQGLWSAYYATLPNELGPTSVWAFEPSIINYECSSLLFLLNKINNVRNIPAAVGPETKICDLNHAHILVDYIKHDVAFVSLNDLLLAPPDFIKIDIEGYEHELIMADKKLLGKVPSIHLELHIPLLNIKKLNYKDITNTIPWEDCEVQNYASGKLSPISLEAELDGFCSLFIKKKGEITVNL
jgi:FkbM family methyltransferase